MRTNIEIDGDLMKEALRLTGRTTIDLIIGTFCIERGHALLHSDRDFEPMERLLGLQAA